jgi:hypothetical protein
MTDRFAAATAAPALNFAALSSLASAMVKPGKRISA